MTWRVGQFFLTIGLVVLVLFWATGEVNQPDWSFFCGGALAVALGVLLIVRDRPPPQETGRFRMIKERGRKRGKGKSRS